MVYLFSVDFDHDSYSAREVPRHEVNAMMSDHDVHYMCRFPSVYSLTPTSPLPTPNISEMHNGTLEFREIKKNMMAIHVTEGDVCGATVVLDDLFEARVLSNWLKHVDFIQLRLHLEKAIEFYWI